MEREECFASTSNSADNPTDKDVARQRHCQAQRAYLSRLSDNEKRTMRARHMASYREKCLQDSRCESSEYDNQVSTCSSSQLNPQVHIEAPKFPSNTTAPITLSRSQDDDFFSFPQPTCRRRRSKLRVRTAPSQVSVLDIPTVCSHCSAKKFAHEATVMCCANGEVKIVSSKMSDIVSNLLTRTDDLGVHFRTYIRAYNNMFAFTSLGVKSDEALRKRTRGIYTFRVQGQVYHFINDLIPADGQPSYLQLYFYDTDHEIEHRLRVAPNLSSDIVAMLIEALKVNPYAAFFRMLKDVEIKDSSKIVIKADSGLDQRVYNAPSASQVAAIWLEDAESASSSDRNVVVFSKSGSSHVISHLYGCYDPLQYPLLFPYGDDGWHIRIDRNVSLSKRCRRRPTLSSSDILPNTLIEFLEMQQRASQIKNSRATVSCCEYYSFKLHDRITENNFLLKFGRLFQQYVVDMYIKAETSRLDFFRNNQTLIRADLYQGVIDGVAMGQHEGQDIGRRIVLPASFIGGPRDMRRRYLDAMALVHHFGKPDIFLTFTCNPSWVEIKQELDSFEEAQNRPDLVSRIFRAKLVELKNDILNKQIFGPVAAFVYVIEFQKRGLPHAHFLIILKDGYKILSPDEYDKYVSAEIPDEGENPHLHSAVLKHMMHGPCGDLNPTNFCMKDGRCKSRYPREFSDYTTTSENSYPIYRRRKRAQKFTVRGKQLDNSWVIPYNAYLLAKYDCHINVEICSTIKAVKYLYKYIYKGHDRIIIQIMADDGTNTTIIDEITCYQSARWISPPEATWRIYRFPLNDIYPSVIILQVHLPNLHRIAFRADQHLQNVLNQDRLRRTMLTEFFEINRVTSDSAKYLYTEFPQHYVWHAAERYWSKRKTHRAIGRMVSANPAEAEKNGLLEADNSAEECLREACTFQMPQVLRRLFATILVYCEPKNPCLLWAEFFEALSEDFRRQFQTHNNFIILQTLRSIDKYLEAMGKRVTDYDLPKISDFEDPVTTFNREIEDELRTSIPTEDLQAVSMLNTSQRLAYNTIMNRIAQKRSGAFFLDGPGGTGKTFLYRAMLAKLRSEGYIAIATASSGIAASILPGGRTAHSRFKIPVDSDESKTCNVSKQSGLAELLRMAVLIIWDEASMAKRSNVESLDAMLRDICAPHLLFGGKVIVFGGDFRQVLPVTPRGSRPETISNSFVNSPIWNQLEKLHLIQNMRALHDPGFSSFILRVGNGFQFSGTKDVLSLPSQLLIPYVDKEASIRSLIDFVFPDIIANSDNTDFITNRAILTPKNDNVDDINASLMDVFPGDVYKYYSFDEAVDSSRENYPTEFLNTLNPPGIPAHEMSLKKNSPVILLRNIDPSSGLCNGTRMVCKRFLPNVIDAEICCGQYKGTRIFIPRIPLQPSVADKFPFQFKRRQFPLRPCFAMTINKAQGQTLQKVGVYLPQPVFSHGQLYVALSRAQKSEDIRVLIVPTDFLHLSETKNIVYEEVLRKAGITLEVNNVSGVDA